MGQRLSTLPQTIWSNLPDKDIVFAYETVREVRILDRRLGIVYYSVILLVFFYVVIGVFIINKKHLDTEKSNGWVVSEVMNSGHSDLNMPFDIYDSNLNPGEQGATFIPTRIVVTKGQTQEDQFCESPLHPCSKDADCEIGNSHIQLPKCVNGMCMRRQWCPAENPQAPTTQVHNNDFANVRAWFKAYVHFHKFLVDVSTTADNKEITYPSKGANTFAVHDLVRMANININEVRENGAIMVVNMIFTCDLDAEICQSNVNSANVDTKTGFNTVHNQYYFEDGIRKRDTYRMYGVRIASFATGISSRTSFSMVILQISSALALFGLARTASDMCLQYYVPERRHYIEQKVQQTEDFND